MTTPDPIDELLAEMRSAYRDSHPAHWDDLHDVPDSDTRALMAQLRNEYFAAQASRPWAQASRLLGLPSQPRKPHRVLARLRLTAAMLLCLTLVGTGLPLTSNASRTVSSAISSDVSSAVSSVVSSVQTAAHVVHDDGERIEILSRSVRLILVQAPETSLLDPSQTEPFQGPSREPSREPIQAQAAFPRAASPRFPRRVR